MSIVKPNETHVKKLARSSIFPVFQFRKNSTCNMNEINCHFLYLEIFRLRLFEIKQRKALETLKTPSNDNKTQQPEGIVVSLMMLSRELRCEIITL